MKLDYINIICGCVGVILLLTTKSVAENNKVARALNYLGAILASGAAICLIT